MHTTDRLKTLRSLGLAIAALLLVGGAVFASQVAKGGDRNSGKNEPQSASADEQGNVENGDAQESQDPSESPEASPDQKADESPGENINNDVNADVNDGPGSTADEQAGQSGDPTESDNESPDGNGQGESNAD